MSTELWAFDDGVDFLFIQKLTGCFGGVGVLQGYHSKQCPASKRLLGHDGLGEIDAEHETVTNYGRWGIFRRFVVYSVDSEISCCEIPAIS